MREMYERRGHEVEVLPHKNWLRGGGVAREVRNAVRERRVGIMMARRLASDRPSVVYVNTAASYAGAVAARQLGVPCIWHLRELFSDLGGELDCAVILRPWVRCEIRRLSTRIVANSRAVAQNVLGGSGGVEIIPNAVEDRFFVDDLDTERIDARKRFGLRIEKRVIGIPGTIRPMKGHRFCLEALGPLLSEDAGLRVIVSGSTDSEFARGVMNAAKALPGGGQVHFLGDQEDMVPFFCCSDVVCVPSSSEPFGRTLVEAMAVGVPVVATRVGGIPEIIEDGETGLLLEFGDSDGLRAAVSSLLRDAGGRRHLAQAARAKADKLYRGAACQEGVTDIVREVLQRPR